MADLFFVCVSCKKMTWSVERKLEKCKAFYDKMECPSVLKGGCYPEYEGFLLGAFYKACFVCGADVKMAARVPCGDGYRYFGICENHVEYLKSMSPPGIAPPYVLGTITPVEKE